MLGWVKDYRVFLWRCWGICFKGDWRFYSWMMFLTIFVLVGVNAYAKQFVYGLQTTGMTDHVSWGVYIANFTFLVGIAAASVMLVIPVYVYRNEELYDVVIFGELLAIAVLFMCMMFVTVDLGQPLRVWHMLPGIGRMNFPNSMLSWDVIVLTGYLLLNMHVSGYLLYMRYLKRRPNPIWYIPFVFISIAWAVSIHTVTAFLFVGLGGRHFWSSAILGPRFIASAFAAGPAFIVLTLQIIRKFSEYPIPDKALLLLRNIIQVSMIINVFLLGNELFHTFYTSYSHMQGSEYLYFGLDGHHALVPWIWTAIALNTTSLVLLLLPLTKSLKFLNLACLICVIGIWIEKGMGMIVPGFIPTPLGEIVEYVPSVNEVLVCLGIWAFGFLLYTILVKTSVLVLQGALNVRKESP